MLERSHNACTGFDIKRRGGCAPAFVRQPWQRQRKSLRLASVAKASFLAASGSKLWLRPSVRRLASSAGYAIESERVCHVSNLLQRARSASSASSPNIPISHSLALFLFSLSAENQHKHSSVVKLALWNLCVAGDEQKIRLRDLIGFDQIHLAFIG